MMYTRISVVVYPSGKAKRLQLGGQAQSTHDASCCETYKIIGWGDLCGPCWEEAFFMRCVSPKGGMPAGLGAWLCIVYTPCISSFFNK